MSTRVLLVDDDLAVRDALGQTLELAALLPTCTGSYIEAKDHIAPDFDGVVLSDIRMPGKDGFDLLKLVQAVDPELPVILLTGEGDIPMAVRGISAGAFDFLEKPCAPADLLAVVGKALKTRALVLENRRLKRKLEDGDAASRLLFGQSKLAQDLRDRVRAVAAASADVLVCGEPGSGTSKVAEVIHLLSGAGRSAFQKHSAALMDPDTLDRAFANAGDGTIYLDEVAALSPAAQFWLLERLETRSRARVIGGTYRNIRVEVEEGRFNPDLFYKLDVMNVRIPSLKERKEDIPVLFRRYVAIAAEQAALPQPEITPETIAGLMKADWPGNARSLMNAAMRFTMGFADPAIDAGSDPGLTEQLAQVEKSLLVAALDRFGGNATEAAQSLKLPRKTFYDKLNRHGIRADDYRS